MVLVTKSLLSRWERLSFSEDLFTPVLIYVYVTAGLQTSDPFGRI